MVTLFRGAPATGSARAPELLPQILGAPGYLRPFPHRAASCASSTGFSWPSETCRRAWLVVNSGPACWLIPTRVLTLSRGLPGAGAPGHRRPGTPGHDMAAQEPQRDTPARRLCAGSDVACSTL